ncbi:hypothetical protein ACP4OV_019689 [Aristida adscensionis]
MEGIIPFVFKAIAQYKEAQGFSTIGSDADEPSPASYVLLQGGDPDVEHWEETNQQQQQLCTASSHSEAVTTCTARPSPLQCSTLRRRA